MRKYLIGGLLGFAVALCLSATTEVRLGDETADPALVQFCIDLIAGEDDLGTDPTDPTFQTAEDKLANDTSLYIKYQDTGTPSDLCTGAGVASTRAGVVCAKEGRSLIQNNVVINDDDVTFSCVVSTTPNQEEFWGRIGCP